MESNFIFHDFCVDLFLWILWELNFANFIKFQKTQKIITCKNISKWSICLNAIYDALIQVLISSMYSSDSLPRNLSIARRNS